MLLLLLFLPKKRLLNQAKKKFFNKTNGHGRLTEHLTNDIRALNVGSYATFNIKTNKKMHKKLKGIEKKSTRKMCGMGNDKKSSPYAQRFIDDNTKKIDSSLKILRLWFQLCTKYKYTHMHSVHTRTRTHAQRQSRTDTWIKKPIFFFVNEHFFCIARCCRLCGLDF